MSIASGKSNILQPTEYDIQMMLACEVHQGSKNLEKQMEKYVHKRKPDGIHVLNLAKTWEKLLLAARVIVAIENPSDVAVISSREYGHRAVLKFAHYTGAHHIAGQFGPGTFTNQIQKNFVEPRLIIVTDPRADHQVTIQTHFFFGQMINQRLNSCYC
jgi:small subunit ribosomal protein SAe